MAPNRTTEWEKATNVATLRTTLSFAIDLVDPVTGTRPWKDVTVSLTDVPADPVTNPSGFRLFFEVETNPVTVAVDGGDHFFDQQISVDHGGLHTGDEPPDPPVKEIRLTPTPAYQFTPGTTLLRGVVSDNPLPSGDGVGDATVSLADVPTENESVEAPTTDGGEYVLRIPVSAERVISDNGDQWLDKAGGSQSSGNGNGPPGNGNGPPGNGNGPNDNGGNDEFDPPTHEVTVSHSDYADSTATIPIRAGRTTRHDVVFD
ncbi:hypothetical protein Harman_33260 [Haloarcula mannanilytica]|uniref:Uncharacterized protein n=1 Tax=Haloarcula mannanilytica TaxID=2509225 RepID=A0A4C2ELG6_9EURY|nr:hypothetical protein [Haloarcula mannanilytica]GCF15391.1 hypothetical protein Harman_33260 [Haloarcula mannanilytica]